MPIFLRNLAFCGLMFVVFGIVAQIVQWASAR